MLLQYVQLFTITLVYIVHRHHFVCVLVDVTICIGVSNYTCPFFIHMSFDGTVCWDVRDSNLDINEYASCPSNAWHNAI